jgi:hypothetical protein
VGSHGFIIAITIVFTMVFFVFAIFGLAQDMAATLAEQRLLSLLKYSPPPLLSLSTARSDLVFFLFLFVF